MLLFATHYGGVQWFLFLSKWTGLPIDQVNFVLTQFLSLAVAPLYRSLLHPARVEAAVRHGFGLALGLLFCYICFGFQTIHLVALPTIAYIIMCLQDPKVIHKSVLAVSLIYLSTIHLYRQFYFISYALDISGPLMVIVQKVTTLAFSLHDGLTKDESELTESQKYHVVNRLPNPFEYFSYIFHHQTLMAGPLVFYADYVNFIYGTYLLDIRATSGINNNSNKHADYEEPSPFWVVLKKNSIAIGCALVMLKLNRLYPTDVVKTEDFINNTSLLYKFWYLHIITSTARLKYYYAWMQADAICNNSGLGFNGYNKNGEPRWNKVSNVNIMQFELAQSLRDGINGWNIGTNHWLRMIVYDRTKKYQTVLTYSLSAVWHGFYLGYYLTFASAALCTVAARTVRRTFRPYFLSTHGKKLFYDVLTTVVTRIYFTYLTFSFVILEFWPSIRIYFRMYMCLHILAVLAVLVLPYLFPNANKRQVETSASRASTVKSDNQFTNGTVKQRID